MPREAGNVHQLQRRGRQRVVEDMSRTQAGGRVQEERP